MKTIYLLICISIWGIMDGQTQQTLTYTDYINIVAQNHPISIAAELMNDRSEAVRLDAVAQFDPKIASEIDRKYFKETEYFTRWNSELKVQTPFAAQFSVGYENNDGNFLNNEASLPDNGLAYASIQLPVLSGLIFDESRYNLRNAKLIAERNDLDRQIMMNQLLFQASVAYVNWLYAYLDVQNYERAVVVTKERLDNSIELFINGDIPAIDTLESTINYNSMRFGLIDGRNKLVKARQQVDLFIWDQEMNPMQLMDNVEPNDLGLTDIYTWIENKENAFIESQINALPSLLKYDNKVSGLQLKRKLIQEDLKPSLDLKFNTLVTLGGDNNLNFSPNDYKYGVRFSYPFFTRKTRAKLKLNSIEQREVELDLESKRLETKLKVTNTFQSIDLLSEQLDLVSQNINMNQRLLDAEREKFSIGESSIFLLNQRELKLLKAILDRNSTESDMIRNYFKLRYILFQL